MGDDLNAKRRIRLRSLIFGGLVFFVAPIAITGLILVAVDLYEPPKDETVIAVCGAAFGAFTVWLTVRIINRRERWAMLTAACLATMTLYSASFGPACWLCERSYLDGRTVWLAYRPLTWLSVCGPSPIAHAIDWWAEFSRRDWYSVPPEPIRLEFHYQHPNTNLL